MTIPFPTAGMYNKGELMIVEGSSLIFQAVFCYLTHWLKHRQYHGVWGFVCMFGFLCACVLLFLVGLGFFSVFSKVPSLLLLIFFSALVRLELRKPVLPECKSSLVVFSELHHGIFFPAKCIFNIKFFQNGKLSRKVIRMFLVIISWQNRWSFSTYKMILDNREERTGGNN